MRKVFLKKAMINGAHRIRHFKKLSSLSTKKVSNSIVYDLRYSGTTVYYDLVFSA